MDPLIPDKIKTTVNKKRTSTRAIKKASKVIFLMFSLDSWKRNRLKRLWLFHPDAV